MSPYIFRHKSQIDYNLLRSFIWKVSGVLLLSYFFLKMFLSILWEFHTLYFDYILTLLPTPSGSSQPSYLPNFIVSFFFSPFSTPPKESNFYSPTTPGCGACPVVWYVVGVTPLKRDDFPSSASNQMPISPQLKVGFHAYIPSSLLGCCLSWACACCHNLHELTCASDLLCLKTLFVWSHPQPLDHIIFLKFFIWDGPGYEGRCMI